MTTMLKKFRLYDSLGALAEASPSVSHERLVARHVENAMQFEDALANWEKMRSPTGSGSPARCAPRETIPRLQDLSG